MPGRTRVTQPSPAPARVYSETLHADAILEAGTLLPLPDDDKDRAIYVTEASVSVAGQEF
jgi:redox-sensitive bicupin YhaK (pirin superfamily)